MKNTNTLTSWLLRYPESGYWNSDQVQKIKGTIQNSLIKNFLLFLLLFADTSILLVWVVSYRISRLGIVNIFSRAKVTKNVPVIYLDLGTHKEGVELSHTINKILPKVCSSYFAYGFEASTDSYKDATEKFSQNENIRILNQAVVYQLPASGKIRLYYDMDGGLGDSIYREGKTYDEVEAIRLSDFIQERDIDIEKSVIILRMNIEGAEYDVIKDLVETGISRRICGYFGMWDDVGKIDPDRGHEFREYLAENQIFTYPFNGRDMKWPPRKLGISYHMNTQILIKLKEM